MSTNELLLLGILLLGAIWMNWNTITSDLTFGKKHQSSNRPSTIDAASPRKEKQQEKVA
jgi:hypothetical protein